MHLVYEKGFTPYESAAFAFAAAERTPKYGDWPHLELMLEETDFACYTIRRLGRETKIVLECRPETDGELEVTVRDQTRKIVVPAGDGMQAILAGTVSVGEDTAVKVCCVKGNVILRSVRFE